MDNKDAPKPRRPLPQQPTHNPVRSASDPHFYGHESSSLAPSSSSSSPPPALPTSTRPKSHGSSLTTYHPPPSPPPTYVRAENSPFREPELITEEPVSVQGTMPELIPHSTWYPDPTYENHPDWANAGGPTWGDPAIAAWQPNASGEWPSDSFDPTTYMTHNNYAVKMVDIDGRDYDEEINWWNTNLRATHKRPGPGILPPVLTDSLHHPEHALLYVLVMSPDIKPRPDPNTSISPSASQQQANPQTQPPSPPLTPPSDDDVRTAVPHPNAYYCRSHNGWVILAWKSSLILPQLSKSFLKINTNPLPDPTRRRKVVSCVGDGEQPFGQTNKTHHFHVYEKAVDSHRLTPPFRRASWERAGRVKEKRRAMTISAEETDLERLQKMEDDVLQTEETEGDLLDLYVCCQCSLHCVASAVVAGVIHVKYIEELVRDKLSNPLPGKSGPVGVVMAWETILRIIENKLWKGENRPLPIYGVAFQQKLGWNPVVEKIFIALGFNPINLQTEDKKVALEAPSVHLNTPESKQYRAKLLRAWVEINIWLSEYIRLNGKALTGFVPHRLWVQTECIREVYQREFGAHHEQLPRGHLPDTIMSYQPIEKAWHCLGLTPSTYTWDLLAFAYLAQCRCDPVNTVGYFTHLSNIVMAMQELGEAPPPELQSLVMEERSRNRFTFDDVHNAAKTLGFGRDGPLGVEFEDDVEEEFIVNAWKDAVRRSWRDAENGASLLRDGQEAFRILCETRGSVKLHQTWEAGNTKMMTPERAYDALEVPKDVDEALLLTVFNLRVQEQQSQTERWREALSTIAEARDSDRLRQFLETGQDPGDVVPQKPQDLPRGLNQLGNTCYLNSLLQYFYTIKELREAVAPMANWDAKAIEDEKLSDDDLKRHRVGGRLVTRREISRSKKFVRYLANLFWQLEYCETPAVTPALELAKLALVTSRDEEEDEADKGGTDSSNDTDATLVEDGPSGYPADIPTHAQSPSVLGKRPRNLTQQSTTVETDRPSPTSPKESDDLMIVSQANSPSRPESPLPMDDAGLNETTSSPSQPSPDSNKDDVTMGDVRVEEQSSKKPPDLPPRKSETSDSTMMFGRQHDVSECMDNCMFQIETALLKFDEISGSQSAKTGVVKRIFYGKLRQRISFAGGNQQSRHSLHEKEDLFSHLHVNVAEDGIDLYDGLAAYFDDTVEFEGKKARLEVSLVELPLLLQIQLQRVQFNRETLQPYKSQAYVKFGETISMDRFLDDADLAKKAQSKALQANLAACRDRIQALTRGNHAPFETSLALTHEFLAKEPSLAPSEIDEGFVAQLHEEHGRMRAELESLRSREIQLKEEWENLWRDNNTAVYELTSVFVHRGSSPSWGHYFFYSRHLPQHPDLWFKYNDSDVTTVSKDEVLADTTGSTANPYLLVFARKDSEIVDTVKRFDPAFASKVETQCLVAL